MRYLPDGEQMKRADQYTIQEVGIPSLTLMERAASACVDQVKAWELDLSEICIVCGSGNNGGDGFAMARIFAKEGYRVTAVLIGNPDHCTQETAHQIEEYRKTTGTFVTEIPDREYSIIIDCIFGVGLCREIQGHYAEVIEWMNQSGCPIMAVDIPSGIDSGTGQVLGIAVKANYTVAIQETKLGHILDPGRAYVGILKTVDIGICRLPLQEDHDVAYTLDAEDYMVKLPARSENSNKGSYGRVLMISGSRGMSGAAYLNTRAAYRTGAGLVRIYTSEDNRVILQSQIPEAILTTYEEFDASGLQECLTWADTVCIGSGLGKSSVSEEILKVTLAYVRQHQVPCVIDADGLNLLAEHMEWLEGGSNHTLILTPHMKEFERISRVTVTDAKKNRLQSVKAFVQTYGLTLVLKDARTVVMGEHTRPYINLSGCQAMAKAGSGDVLAGIITSMSAQKLRPVDAAILGVYVHGASGDALKEEKGSYGLLAGELADMSALVMKNLEEQKTL